MDWNEVSTVIKKYAPVLGNVVGSFVPGAGAIGTGIALIASAFGVEDDNPSPEQIYNAIQADPEAILKLKQIEIENKTELVKLSIESDKLYLQDVQNARQRQVEHEKVTGKTDVNLYVLAWVIVSGFFGLTALMFFKPVPETSSQAIYMLFGGLISGFTAVIGYFFGSSKGSADKTKILSTGNK